jgi:DHA1 family chloramphenicol resistance protein-like MFS transporter
LRRKETVAEIATDLGVPVGAAGLLTSVFAVGMVLGAPTKGGRRSTWQLAAFFVSHVVAAVAPERTSPSR